MRSKLYDLTISFLILVDAVVQVVDEIWYHNFNLIIFYAVMQSLFIIDFIFRIIRHNNQLKQFFLTFWNISDGIFSILLVLSLVINEIHFLRFLRILRLARIFEFYSEHNGDARVIQDSIKNSFVCVCYVFALSMLFFIYFSISGVILFKEANPIYFKGNLVIILIISSILWLSSHFVLLL